MAYNIISLILNIARFHNNNLNDYSSKYLNRINAVGEQLEFYIKDAISGSFKMPIDLKEKEHNKVFSWLGNQNHPPDIIIKGGDALEIKKIEGQGSAIALNSSPPKDVLHSSDKRILAACRDCEDKPWTEKDIFYAVGYTKDKILKTLFLIQGTCYAAKKEVYDGISDPLKKEIDLLIKKLGLEKRTTMELGKIRNADPLGITELRIRGMWHIQNPIKVYAKLCNFDYRKEFSLFAIMDSKKYGSFPKQDIEILEASKDITVKDIKIKDPNNPAKFKDAKLISFSF